MSFTNLFISLIIFMIMVTGLGYYYSGFAEQYVREYPGQVGAYEPNSTWEMFNRMEEMTQISGNMTESMNATISAVAAGNIFNIFSPALLFFKSFGLLLLKVPAIIIAVAQDSIYLLETFGVPPMFTTAIYAIVIFITITTVLAILVNRRGV